MRPETAPSGNSPHILPLESEIRPLQIVVPHLNPALTAKALEAAVYLARGFDAAVILTAVYVLPYPAPLECQEGIRERMESELLALARTTPGDVKAKLVFARDRETAFCGLLPPRALVVIGTRRHWWPTREVRFARRLTAAGHSVAVIRVN